MIEKYVKEKLYINKLILKYDIPISVNHYIKARSFLIGGKPQISIYETKEARDFKKGFVKYIKDEIKKQNFEIVLDKFQFTNVDVTWYFPRIDMDSNNYWKLSLDSLTESGIWVDDNTTLERAKRIYYDSKNPHMVMEIYYSEYIGIFDNRTQFELFVSNCIQCSRYKNGKCSILNKALESRIQEEINNNVCERFKPTKGLR